MKGTVKAEGIELVPTYSHPSETFGASSSSRVRSRRDVDVIYLIARERGFD